MSLTNYPDNMASLILKAEEKLSELEAKLNHKACKKLGELYTTTSKSRGKRNVDLFNQLGYLPNAFRNKKSEKRGRLDDMSGVYVLAAINKKTGKTEPVYVGISRAIFRRLERHGWGKRHTEASFAYLKAKHKSGHLGLRKEMPKSSLEAQQKIIRNYKVALVAEACDFDMYFMEAYFAGKWKTKWNSFKTH